MPMNPGKGWFDSLAENISDFVLVLDGQNRLKYRNPAFQSYARIQESLGLGETPLEGQDFSLWFPPEEQKSVQYEWELCRTQGEALSFESGNTQSMDQSGGIFWEAVPLEKSQIRLLGRSWVQSVPSLWKRFGQAMEDNLNAVLVMDSEGSVIYSNSQYRQMSGYLQTELLGLPIQPEGESKNNPAGRECRLALDRGEGWRGTLLQRRSNGSFYWERAVFTPLPDALEDRLYYLKVSEDITSEQLQVQELRTAQEQMDNLLWSLQDVVWSKSLRTGQLLFVNRAATELFGLPLEAFYGNPELFREQIHPDDLERRDEAQRALLEKGGLDLEYRVQHSSGQWRWVQDRSRLVRGEGGEALRVDGHFTDVTRSHKLLEELIRTKEELEDQVRSKDNFAHTLSHEVRTPLSSLSGLVDMLREAPRTTEEREHFRLLEESLEQLRTLVNDVLDYRKLESGQMELESLEFSLGSFFTELLEAHRPTARTKGLSLDLDLARNLPLRVMGDPLRIRQIVQNFLGNALKFTQEGSISLLVRDCTPDKRRAREGSSHVVGDGAFTLEIRVRDTGPGIPPDRASRLFQPFSQLDSSVSRTHGGTGLGLSLCKALAEMMDGEIGFDSQPGQGADFWVRLPLNRVSDQAPSVSHQQASTGPKSLPYPPVWKGKRVLAAEDNAVGRLILRKILEGAGLELTLVENGQEFLEAARQADYDLHILDASMPVLDGFEAAAALRAWESQASNQDTLPTGDQAVGPDGVPHRLVMILSAHNPEDIRELCERSGVDQVLAKPLDRNKLREVLEHWPPPD